MEFMDESLQLIKGSASIWDPGWHNSVNTRKRQLSNERLTSPHHAAKETHRVLSATLTELSDTSNKGDGDLEAVPPGFEDGREVDAKERNMEIELAEEKNEEKVGVVARLRE